MDAMLSRHGAGRVYAFHKSCRLCHGCTVLAVRATTMSPYSPGTGIPFQPSSHDGIMPLTEASIQKQCPAVLSWRESGYWLPTNRPTSLSGRTLDVCLCLQRKFDEAVHLWAWDGVRACASEQGRGRGPKVWRASLMWVVDGMRVLEGCRCFACLLSCLLAACLDASMDGRLLARRLAK